MRRVLATLGTASLLLAAGCGLQSYEKRIDLTLEKMKYEERLNRMLMPADTSGKWQEMNIYLRAPKDMAAAKEFLLPPTEPGKFDLEKSFFDQSKQQSLHVLARTKKAKAAAGKKKAATPADTADRSNFSRDVITVLTTAFSPPDEVTNAMFKPETKKNNEFKQATLTLPDKVIKTYLYKKEPYDVALIFEIPTAEVSNLTGKMNLSLESFATGKKAENALKGNTSEDEAVGPVGGVAF
ncbi:hypothetical protein [Singulisphaera sp. PoT]|uniref:hypothetical protein n=1 Tax=Singulisphaera sp. PoT TaxID=3411797 RepID=UPI003BF58D24